MKFIPHQYQRFAIEKIVQQNSTGLLLDMGLGKTVITLTAIEELLYDRFDASKVLVIAPLRVADTTWPDEISKWDHLKHLRISKVLGSASERVMGLQTPADIYVINRENVEWLVKHFEGMKEKWPFDMVVIDELSSFKSNKAKRFRALRKMRPQIKRIVGLTGTPTPNGLIDLWPQVYLLDQGERLGKTLTGYRDRYFLPDKRNRQVVFSYKPRPEAEDAIYEKLSDLCVSMKAADWLDMPERIDRIVPVTLSGEAMDKYQQLERDLLLPVSEDTDVVADTAAVLSNKLLQMANGAVYDERDRVLDIHDEKLAALEDLVESANGKPLLVFYNYKHDLHRIQARFKQATTLDTSKDIERWNAGELPLLLAHPASAGHGLNLQHGGNTIVWFGLNWSLELYQQANARLHRQGQKQNVIIYHLVAQKTVDEDVMRAIKNKDLSQEALLAALKARIRRVQDGIE